MRSFLVPVVALALTFPAFAVTHAVLPDSSIQAKIDLAQPGDIIAIFGGTYTQDVTVNKAIRLVEVDGQDVLITGNVTFTGITNAPPFEGFVVGSAGKGITIVNTTGIVLKNIDARPGIGLVVNGTSRVGITGGLYSQISQDGGELTTTLTQVTGDLGATLNAQKTIVFRTSVGGSVNLSSKKTWVGYSSLIKASFVLTNSNLIIVGNTFLARPYSTVIGVSGTGSSLQIMNNSLFGASWHNNIGYFPGQGIDIAGSNHQIKILNNVITMSRINKPDGSNPWSFGRGIRIAASFGECHIYNNIIVEPDVGIDAPYGALIRNNLVYIPFRSNVAGGAVAEATLSGDPLFVSGQAPKLQQSSPCINAGVNVPIYNDRDGSQNDIGALGGPLYDPDGWTTTNPVVISFDLAPQQLLKGVDTSVNLTNGQAVAQP